MKMFVWLYLTIPCVINNCYVLHVLLLATLESTLIELLSCMHYDYDWLGIYLQLSTQRTYKVWRVNVCRVDVKLTLYSFV